ncbi:MAG: hypothetical protein ACYSVY_14310, partial [Planctomycetota bacterium]
MALNHALRNVRPEHSLHSGQISDVLTLFGASETVGRITGNNAVVNLVTAANLSAPVTLRVRCAEHPDDLPDTRNVSHIYSATEPLERIEL